MNNKTADTAELVSVIIPAYNRQDFIRQTIDSVLQQTYPCIELLVIDDGSTDKTRNILEEYRDKLCLLEHPGRINKGQSAAINLGLKRAAGEYICILDSDDYWEPNKVEKQAIFLKNHAHVGLVYSNGTAVDENNRYLYDMYTEDHQEENRPEKVLQNCYFLVPNNAMIRARIFQITGLFDEELRSAQDHDMAIRISEVTKLAYMPDKLFHYRRHTYSISRKNADLRWNNGFYILKKATERYDYSTKAVRKRKAVLHFRMFQCTLEKNRFWKSLPHLIKAGFYDPLRAIKVILGRENTSGLH